MDPDQGSLNVQIVRGNAKNRLFMEADKRILIQGNCQLCGFQNSKEIIINGKCKKSNFDQISKKVDVSGNVSGCVFNGVGQVRISGTAKKCTFIGVDRRDISISDGTGKGCTLDGAPLIINSRTVQKVFSFGAGPGVLGSFTAGSDDGRKVERVQPKVKDTERTNETFVVARRRTVIDNSRSSVSIGQVKSGGISWGPINIRGGMMMRGYTIEVTGYGTIGDIPVTPGRYARRLGDADTLYRQELSANPASSPWQLYENGQWTPSELTPTF